MRKVSAIVPAAGLSRRFGGPNKLLQPWGDTTVVGAVVSTLRECGLAVLVVTGRDAELVAKAVAPSPTVFNPRFEEGLGTSISCGVRAAQNHSSAGFQPVLPQAYDGYLIALGDMPTLRADIVRKILETFETAPLDAILAPVYQDESDRPGHPVLFGAAHCPELQLLEGDSGAKSIMQANADKMQFVAVEGRLDDLDLLA